MKKSIKILSGITFLIAMMIPTPHQGQFVVSAPNLELLQGKEAIASKIRHSEHIARLMQQINEARRTVREIMAVKRDIERTYDFATSLVNLSELRSIPEFNMRSSIECLMGFSLNPADYFPRLNRGRGRYFIGCPSAETAVTMIEDLDAWTSRYGWEKMMQRNQLMTSQYMQRLIEQMKKTNAAMERELANKKNEMTKGEYLELLARVQETNGKILALSRENNQLIYQATQPTDTEIRNLYNSYQQALLFQQVSFSTSPYYSRKK